MSPGRQSPFHHKLVYSVDDGRSIPTRARKDFEIYSFLVLHLLIKCLLTKLRTKQSVHQVLLYVNSSEKWTGMKITGLKIPEKV